jgi:hypothetical protein
MGKNSYVEVIATSNVTVPYYDLVKVRFVSTILFLHGSCIMKLYLQLGYLPPTSWFELVTEESRIES